MKRNNADALADIVTCCLADGVTECVGWPYARQPNGYGACNGKWGSRLAHRASLILATGENRHGMQAAHSCHNRACVNPHHLRWATSQENHDDMVEIGMSTRGVKNPQAKLDPNSVREIRRYLAEGWPQSVVARHYGVHPQYVSLIKSRRRWGWLDESVQEDAA